MNDLSPPVQRFADDYIKDGKKQANALKQWPDLSPEVASVKANRLLKNDNVREYIQGRALKSAKNIAKIADSGKHDAITLTANRDILDRAGYKPTTEDNSPATQLPAEEQRAYLKAITKALSSGDSVALERVVLNPSD